MRDEYNISELNPRKNPYANRLKKQITINIDGGTIDYFKSLADAKGIPYQTLINLYLRDCADNHRQLQLSCSNAFARLFFHPTKLHSIVQQDGCTFHCKKYSYPEILLFSAKAHFTHTQHPIDE